MLYRIIITKNYKLHKIIHEYKYKNAAFNKYNKMKAENQAFYEKKWKNYGKVKRVITEVLLLESKNGEDKEYTTINKNGETIVEVTNSDWNIVHKFVLKQEETFYSYNLKKRVKVKEILKTQTKKPKNKNYCVVNIFNKLVIYNEEDIEILLCKNIPEANRLQKFLAKALFDARCKNFLFFGESTIKIRKMLADRMLKVMEVHKCELYRKSTKS